MPCWGWKLVLWPEPTAPELAARVNPATSLSRIGGGSPAERCRAWLGRAAASLFCSSAPTAAAPITDPTWRLVFSKPEAAPATGGSMSRMATVVMGGNTHPMPAPATRNGGRKSYHAELGVAISAAQPMPEANRTRQVIRMYFPPVRSDSLPAAGATNMVMPVAGASVRPAFRAEKPRTDWR